MFKHARSAHEFICESCGHKFITTLKGISSAGSWCPYCSGRSICQDRDCGVCNGKTFASDPKSKFWSSRNVLKPHQVPRCSSKKFWFWCEECGHEFDVRLDDCTRRGNWCSYCAGKKLCSSDDCMICFGRSFASQPRSAFWSKQNIEKPRTLMKNSHKSFIFDCEECKHSFETRLYSITQHDQWCPYCKGDSLCDNLNCEKCFEYSFASHYRAEFWSSQNKILPRKVRKCSGKKFWFTCGICSHDFEGILTNIIQNDAWCPYCSSPPKKLCISHDCDHCFINSAASHPRSKFWSPLNKVKPRFVFKNSHNKYTYVCDECRFPFQITPNNIVSGNWCPMCKHKTEKKLFDWLVSEYPGLTITRQKRFEWCVNPNTGRYLYFDFYIKEINVVIELDGPQHFRQIHNWEPPEEVKRRDIYKECCAATNNILVIRLLQEDVLRDNIEWRESLKEMIESRDDDSGYVYTIYSDLAECRSYLDNLL